MRRIALLSEYEGTHFSGWQMQPAVRTVQNCLQKALVDLVPENKVTVYGCSRTDAGVHARGHVCHFDTAASIPADRLPLALTSRLPDDLVVRQACDVSTGFHARYDAQGKRYSYTYWNHCTRPALQRQTLCYVPGPFDLAAFKAAMPYFLGEQDFSALQDQNDDDPVSIRRIDRLAVTVTGCQIKLTVQGSGFLYHMVRILAGTLLAVAQGKIPPDTIAARLVNGDRRLMGKTMPASGLCLEEVLYNPPLFPRGQREEKRKDHAEYTLE